MGREDYRETIILFSPYVNLLTAYTYKYLFLDYNKKLNSTCCVKLIRADCIILLLDIIDRYSNIVKVNLNARGFSDFTRLTLPIHSEQIVNILLANYIKIRCYREAKLTKDNIMQFRSFSRELASCFHIYLTNSY